MPAENEPKSVIEVVKKYLVKTEQRKTQALAKRLAAARKRGYLTKKEFLDICIWKSPRPVRHYKSNSGEKIKTVTKKAFAQKHEITKLSLLTSLKGVSIPVASAILTALDPVSYGIIDIRVWQVLYKYGAVKNNPRGQNFNAKQWYRYLILLRAYSRKTGLSCRKIEFTLFRYHQDHVQKGKLYD